jgi:hypothetical protein
MTGRCRDRNPRSPRVGASRRDADYVVGPDPRPRVRGPVHGRSRWHDCSENWDRVGRGQPAPIMNLGVPECLPGRPRPHVRLGGSSRPYRGIGLFPARQYDHAEASGVRHQFPGACRSLGGVFRERRYGPPRIDYETSDHDLVDCAEPDVELHERPAKPMSYVRPNRKVRNCEDVAPRAGRDPADLYEYFGWDVHDFRLPWVHASRARVKWQHHVLA